MYYVSEKMEGSVAATMANCTANGKQTTELYERRLVMKKITLVFVLVFVLVMIPLSMNACSSQSKLDAALLEFPGLKWGDTPEQVIEKLKLTEDQILENAMQIPAEDAAKMEYDVWNLTITDWTFLHSKVVGGQFTFVRYPGCAFGLSGYNSISLMIQI